MAERTPWRVDLNSVEPTPNAGRLAAIERLRQFIRRSFRLIAITTALTTLAALIYAFSATPIFTATSQVLIETQSLQQPTLRFNENRLALDTPQVESQLALLRSERIAEKAAKSVNLAVAADDEKSSAPLSGVIDWIGGFLPSLPSFSTPEVPDSADEVDRVKLRAAIIEIQNSMDVARVGISHVLEITYNSTDAAHAAKMANAIADAYVADRLETRKEAARRGSAWLEDQIDALRLQMNAANLEVQTFRARRDYRIRGSAGAATRNQGSRTIRGVTGRGPVSGAAGSDVAGAAVGAAEGDDALPATLEELESRADTFQKIYESYLQAYTETVQRQSYPVTNARVITDASKPKKKSSPKRGLILLGGIILGGIFGVGLAMMRSAFDYRVNSPKQIREDLGVECLGMIARHDTRTKGAPLQRLLDQGREMLGLKSDDEMTVRLREVHDMPMSRFSRGIKSVRTAINVATKSAPVKVYGITSSMPREGKTTFASNLAVLHQSSNARTLLIDADVHNPALTRAMQPDTERGLLEVLNGEATFDECLVAHTDVRPDFLPLHLGTQSHDAGGALAEDVLKSLFDVLKDRYDVIVVDMPPLKPATEALALSGVLDGVLVVAEWENTPIPALADTLYELRRVDASVIGVVVTKVLRMQVELYGARVRGRAYTG